MAQSWLGKEVGNQETADQEECGTPQRDQVNTNLAQQHRCSKLNSVKTLVMALTLKMSSSEAADTASFIALSNSSSAVRSPEMARRISGPMSCSVRKPAWNPEGCVKTFY